MESGERLVRRAVAVLEIRNSRSYGNACSLQTNSTKSGERLVRRAVVPPPPAPPPLPPSALPSSGCPQRTKNLRGKTFFTELFKLFLLAANWRLPTANTIFILGAWTEFLSIFL